MTREDLIMYRGLKAVITSGKYDVKGDAIIKVASLFHWFNGLEKKIEEAAATPALETSPIESLGSAEDQE